jgi:hypothetical protein
MLVKQWFFPTNFVICSLPKILGNCFFFQKCFGSVNSTNIANNHVFVGEKNPHQILEYHKIWKKIKLIFYFILNSFLKHANPSVEAS